MPPLNGLLRRSCIHGLPVYLSRVARVVSPLNVARVYDDDEQSEYERAAATDFFLFFFFFLRFDVERARIYRVRFRLSERAITEPG